MGQAGYELLSLGMRYVFTGLLALFLLRAAMLMRRERRDRARVLRRLPDAGLVGELVTLADGKGYPLGREGVLGSGRGCDIRLAGLRQRELEFAFQPGRGVLLRPIHGRVRALLDGEAFSSRNMWALHGTVLELRGMALRFRLFAGLKVPERTKRRQQDAQVTQVGSAQEQPAAPQTDWDITWRYAPLPPGWTPGAGWDAAAAPEASGDPWSAAPVVGPGTAQYPPRDDSVPYDVYPRADMYPQQYLLQQPFVDVYATQPAIPAQPEDILYPADCYPTGDEAADTISQPPEYGAQPEIPVGTPEQDMPRYAAFQPDEQPENLQQGEESAMPHGRRAARRRRAAGGGGR